MLTDSYALEIGRPIPRKIPSYLVCKFCIDVLNVIAYKFLSSHQQVNCWQVKKQGVSDNGATPVSNLS